MRMRLIAPLLLVALAPLLLGGCLGSGGPEKNASRYDGQERQVAEVIDRMAALSREGDGDAICAELFTEALVKSVESASGTTCGVEVSRNVKADDASLTITSLEISGNVALVKVTDQKGRKSRLLLGRPANTWRIVQIV